MPKKKTAIQESDLVLTDDLMTPVPVETMLPGVEITVTRT